jgi:hypothetical protein
MVVASDSRLRARGPMDRAQKIYQLARGHCCLSFCGDAQIAYPLFVQVSVVLDNHLRTSSRALEPVEALQSLLREPDNGNALSIGGAAQMVKIYPFARTIPLVVRTSKNDHFLLGRRLFSWEVTNIRSWICPASGKRAFFTPKSSIRRPTPCAANAYKEDSSI